MRLENYNTKGTNDKQRDLEELNGAGLDKISLLSIRLFVARAVLPTHCAVFFISTVLYS